MPKRKKKKKKLTKEDEATLDELAVLMKDVPPERLYAILRKSRVIQIKVSRYDHEDIKATAHRLGLTTTEYLIRLHYITKEAIRNKLVIS